MALDAVFFDLDGTLLDTAPDFQQVVNQLRAEHDLPPLDYTPIRATVSDGAGALVRLALGLADTDPAFEPARQRLLALYEAQGHRASQPFEGIAETLAWLAAHRIPWGVVTNKPVRYAEPLMAAMEFEPAPAVLLCPDHVTQRKPHPEPLLRACTLTHAQPARSVYVGDHARDIESGRHAGLQTVAAAWGYLHDAAQVQDWQATHILYSALGLPALLGRLHHDTPEAP